MSIDKPSMAEGVQDRDVNGVDGQAAAQRKLIAYEIESDTGLQLVPAPAPRDWIDDTPDGFAKRCLPLLIANQPGWVILNNETVHLTWDGGLEKSSIQIEYPGRVPSYPAMSHFGSGIVTWSLPYLFRTPEGFNLWARGPVNLPKDGIQALEGIVEGDWSPATFTMNWMMTRPGYNVTFEMGEPICMLVPVRRGDVESMRPEVRPITSDREVYQAYSAFNESRQTFLTELREPGSEAAELGWEKHYFQGKTAQGGRAREHQTKLRVRKFKRIARDAS